MLIQVKLSTCIALWHWRRVKLVIVFSLFGLLLFFVLKMGWGSYEVPDHLLENGGFCYQNLHYLLGVPI